MDHRDVKAFAASLAPVVHGFVVDSVAKALAPFTDRLKAVEDRQPERGEKGEPGERGADGLPGRDGKDGADGLAGPAGQRGEKGEPGERGADGAPGRDGKDGADGLAGPVGERGEKGDPGEPGLAGADGRDGVDGKDAPPVTRERLLEALTADPSLVREAVAAWLAENPPPAGKDGSPGERGEAGAAGAPGADGKDGAPGRDGQPGVPGRDGKDGAPGKDGVDGFGLEDFEVSSSDGGRTLVLSFQRGDVSVRRELVTDIVLDRGVWKEQAWRKGDGVTWGGSFWIAQRDTDAKPDTPDSGWRLAVKRGRDGKDGKPGERGERGVPGTPGRDGRQY